MMNWASIDSTSFGLLDQLPIGAVALDSEFRVLSWNACVEQWSGIGREKMLGFDIRERFPQLNESKYTRRLEQVFRLGLSAVFCSQLHGYIIPCPLSTGAMRVQSTTVTPLKAPEGSETPYHALISIQDITDLTKQAQKYRNMRDRALREAEERSRVEAQIRQLNEQLERRVAERTLQVQEMNSELTHEINERKHAQKALSQSERLLSLIFDTVSVGLSVVNERGAYLRVNQAYCRIVGYGSPAELIGKPYTMLYPPDDGAPALERLQELFDGPDGEELQGERVIVTHERGTVDVFFVTTKFTNEQGERFVITAITDITLMKRAENEIRAALHKEKELGELKSHFVSLVSHEFRTPMTIIMSSVELLQNATLKEDRRKTLLFRIETSIQRMTELLEDVLFIEKTGQEAIAFRPHKTHIPELCRRLIDEAVAAYSSNRNAERVVRMQLLGETESCTTAYLDEQLLRYILLNLLINAFKYSPNTTTVYFDVICTQTHIVFRVQDKGIGIPEEDRPKIFELFHRGKNAGNIYGTGLGLAIVKRSVDAHGGMIEFESKVGEGTTFTVSLPRLTELPENVVSAS